jgi:hypothetical protein
LIFRSAVSTTLILDGAMGRLSFKNGEPERL